MWMQKKQERLSQPGSKNHLEIRAEDESIQASRHQPQ